jgi:type IV pilus assembly protein PilW
MWKTKGNDGFTLTELMVAMVIAAVVMGAIYSAYISQQKAYAVTESVTEAQQNLRAAMYALESDIRLAGFDPKATKAFGFGTVPNNATSITFTYDINSNPALNGNGVVDAGETITYQWNSTNKTLTLASAADVVANNITDIRFTGLGSDGATVATSVKNIRFVRVVATALVRNHTKQLTATILCRNMGL